MKELDVFLEEWREDPLKAKTVFKQYYDYLASLPGMKFSFKARPGVSYSLRASRQAQTKRDLFTLIDVIDDDPQNRWLSVCFYADMVEDPEDLGDFVPAGLNNEDALCFNLDEDDAHISEYILKRLSEAANKANEAG